MTERFYIEKFQEQFCQEGFDNFDSLWDYTGEWVEPVNKRRGGWSGVCRLSIPNTAEPPFYLKRQENHNTKTFKHPFRGIPTYLREVNNVHQFNRFGIPTIELVYYGERKQQNKHQAILISRALDEYEELEPWITKANEKQLNEMLQKLAKQIRNMHAKGLMHMYLNSSSILVRKTKKSLLEKSSIDIRIIDLESVRIQPISKQRRYKDLYYMLNNISGLSNQNFSDFLKYYFESKPAFPGAKNMHARLLRGLE